MNEHRVQALPAFVVAIIGPAIGPASAISYTLDVTFPNGVKRVGPIAPQSGRYPDTIDVRAHAVNSFVWVFTIMDNLVMAPPELPDVAPCPGGG